MGFSYDTWGGSWGTSWGGSWGTGTPTLPEAVGTGRKKHWWEEPQAKPRKKFDEEAEVMAIVECLNALGMFD